MNMCSKLLVVSLIFPLSMVCAAHDHSYTTGSNDNVPWLSSELLGPGVAVEPWGSLVGTTKSAQVGWFSNLVSDVTSQFTNGVVLSTGRIEQGATVTNYLDCTSWGSDETMNYSTTADRDSDLARSSDVQLKKLSDVAGLVLYVVPQNKTINIPFMMASEEFFYPFEDEEVPNFNNPYDAETYADYSDKFAFFLKKGKIEVGSKDAARDMGFTADDNIARLPDGSMVEIASVNQYTNQAYFVANVVTNGPNDRGEDELNLVFPTGDMPIPMEYNGAIIGPTAVCTNVEPGEVYTIKIVISDYGDRYNNSVIFLKDHGITSGADLKIDVSGPVMLSEAGNAVISDTVSNVGPAPAEGVQVTHYLPIGVNPEMVKGNITCTAGEVDPNSWGEVGGTNYFVWTIGNGFASGSNAVMTINCNLPTPGSYTNCATVATSTGDYDETNNSDVHETKVAAPDTTPITIKVDEKTEIYTGNPLKASYTKTEGEFAEGHQLYVTFDVASITDAGKTDVTVSGCVVSNGAEDVTAKYTIAVVPGWLEVTKRKVTLTSSGAEKTYNGTPLTKDEVVPSGDGFVEGEGATWEVTGTQTFVGESDNTFTYNLKTGTSADNYDVSTQFGKLKVTVVETPIVITVQGSSKKYDGTALTDESATFSYTQDVLAGEDKLEVTLTDASITDVGTSNVTVKTRKVMHGEADVTGCYTFGDPIPGVLEVTKRNVTLTSHGGEKPYDATELTNHEDPDVGGDGFADDEGVKEYSFTGSQTAVGKSDNTFTYALKDNTKAGNYQITPSYGELKVTKVVTAAKITVDNLSKPYDKMPLIATYQVEGILPGDVLQVTLSVESITAAGSTEVTVTGKKVTRGGVDVTADYTFEVVSGSLEVTKVPLTITARSNTKKYGTPTAFSGKEYTVTEGKLFSGDKITQVIMTCKGADKTAPFTDEGYPIEVKKVLGTGLENYEITTVDGLLKLIKLPLTITADNTNKVYGTEVKFAGTEFKITDGTLVNGDTVTNVTLTSEGAAKEKFWQEGGYEIIADYPVDGNGFGNYDIKFLPGKLTVDKRKITITAGITNKVYGTEIELDRTAFKITEGELAEGDTVTEVTLTSEGAAEGAEYQEEDYPIVPSHDIVGNIETNNYDIAFSNGTLTVEKAELTIAVDDVKWRIGKERPDNSFSISPDQLKAGDTVEQITGGNVTYTNAVWTEEHPAPTYTDKDKYENEIWVDLSRLTGTRAKNYDISVDPGMLEIASAEVKFEVALSGEENGLGVQELTLTITNKGDPIDADYDYWVELMPGTNETGKLVYCICKGMSVSSDWKFSPIRTAQMGDGSDYINLTDEVTNALWTVVGNRDGVFGTDEVVMIDGISFYHSDVSGKRHDIMSVLGGDASAFIKAGKLFNVADLNKDFTIDDDEKEKAAWLLGENTVADYLEMTRLALLRYYHWDAKEGTWIGPSKDE